ncbi:DUF826 domain-containing protein [Salmonella enterica subsp. enterica serovar Glostrup]|nr:DUF826 domain-containing protein [Salmonella enterica]EDQ4202274.1 DUF826 domain-containing protein [Salmonella enterica subsp. enterica serovar Glostrup]EDV0529277.1 DUF826 domain-containing protein [Salmonella enterica subsp. enterica]EGK5851242.1 DUF826 domain-containing protein [Salmonella enterica]
MSDMKDIVTDDMVKNALRSDTVTTAVKTQIKSTLDQQIDAAGSTCERTYDKVTRNSNGN